MCSPSRLVIHHLPSVVMVSLRELVRGELAEGLVGSYRSIDAFPFAQGLVECGEVEARAREFQAFLSMGSLCPFHVAYFAWGNAVATQTDGCLAADTPTRTDPETLSHHPPVSP